ncbi:interleukin-17 domain-containing protein [Ditylenchus destructor]|uniref:Interleukin-17 domain-containing protein n=1 Tax=Ditylenchus destructor TaxID=166010 RepID=A0AAD4MVF2_9BILA|nr:interleukin-17 domain-containing protein [Ditylenchus destructor]
MLLASWILLLATNSPMMVSVAYANNYRIQISTFRRMFSVQPNKQIEAKKCIIENMSHEQMKRTLMFAKETMFPNALNSTSGNGHNSFDVDTACHNANSPPNMEISPDMPLEERALCGFRYEDNVNERRIPEKIKEVKCLCKAPTSKDLSQRIEFRCETVYHDVTVLVLGETCTNYQQKVERIAVACVTVMGTQSTSAVNVAIGNGTKLPVEG